MRIWKTRGHSYNRGAISPVPSRGRGEIGVSPPSAVVMTGVWRRRTRDAGNRAQIFVDGPQVMVTQVSDIGPRHYLKKIAVERSRNATCVDRASTGRMEGIR